MLKEILENIDKKVRYSVVYKGDDSVLKVLKNGEILFSNNSGINKSLANLAFNVTKKDLEMGGYERGGTKEKTLWVKDVIKEIANKMSGNSKKFADELGKALKLPGKFSAYE